MTFGVIALSCMIGVCGSGQQFTSGSFEKHVLVLLPLLLSQDTFTVRHGVMSVVQLCDRVHPSSDIC